MAIIGYLEGTNPEVLSTLIAKGHDTMPVGNGWDGHGKYVGHLTKSNEISAVVGYLHKVVPPRTQNVTASDVLSACQINKIPVVIIAPKSEHKEAKKALGDVSDFAKLVDPTNILDEVLKVV